MGDGVIYEGEEMYEKKEELFTMDRFDPDSELENAKEKPNLSKKNIGNETKAASAEDNDDKAKDPGGRKKRRKKSKKGTKQSDEAEGFTVLGDPTDSQKKKVARVLPHWLAHPDIMQVDLQAEQLAVGAMEGLPSNLTDRLSKEGVTHLFPVQRQVIPRLLSLSTLYPRLRPPDVCVAAPTGSGKTLAFVLPIVASLQGRMVPRVRAIAVLPTQDLALQVFKVFSTYCESCGLKVKLLTGGDSVVGEDGLVKKCGNGAVLQLWDILVVTPGRLTHTIRSCPSLDLSHLRYLVIDEADRMMENIAQDWLNLLENAVYTEDRPRPSPYLTVASMMDSVNLPLQKLLFSATLSHDPEQLEQLNLFEPKLFRCVVPPKDIVGGSTTGKPGEYTFPAELSQQYVITSAQDRPLMVTLLIRKLKLQRVLVFTHSTESVHRLALLLANLGHATGELHSLVKKRRKVLNQLEAGNLQLVVCSDALARGIDVNDLDGVISYDAPTHLKTYVHRVGRTARAGKVGTAVTLSEEKQVKNFLKMTREGGVNGLAKAEVLDEELDGLREEYKASLEKTKLDLEEEKQQRQKKQVKRKAESTNLSSFGSKKRKKV